VSCPFRFDIIVFPMALRAAGVAGLIAVALGGLATEAQDLDITLAITAAPLAAAMARHADTIPLPQPFTPAERFAYYLHRTYSPHRLGLLALETAFDHSLGQPACWDRGLGSYVTRYSRALDRRMIRNTAEFGAGILTGVDLRYQPLGSGPLQTRVWNTVRSAFVARTASGGQRPAYTRFAAATVAEVGTAHWTGQRIQATWLAQALAWGALDQIQTNLLDEFGPDFRRIGGRMCKRLHVVPKDLCQSPRR
jgi:hypothetical protein